MFEYWGQTIILAWKYASTNEEDGEDLLNNRLKIETEIIQEAFFYAIMTKRKISQKFLLVFLNEICLKFIGLFSWLRNLRLRTIHLKK